jgi:nucleoid-associated protein YgaU
MRKDVKFGLTIGAILVVTLVIYVIVLSRGPALPPHISTIVAQNPADQSADSDNPIPPANNSAAAPKDGADDQQDVAAIPPPDDSTTTPPPASVNAPATQPTANPQTSAADWQKVLDNGLAPGASSPQHTITPTIDPTSSTAMNHPGIAPTANTPLIDPIPATQPSRFLMSNLPPMYATDPAPAITTPPVASIPAPAPTIDPASTPRTHRVAAGESPYSISQLVYGSGRYYKKILAANPNIDPHRLKIGQILVIPELSDTDRPAAVRSAPAAVDSSTSYVVVSGDTLETISRKLYGGPSMIEDLYQANKTLIGPDENVLKIGWVLKLPSAPTVGAQR